MSVVDELACRIEVFLFRIVLGHVIERSLPEIIPCKCEFARYCSRVEQELRNAVNDILRRKDADAAITLPAAVVATGRVDKVQCKDMLIIRPANRGAAGSAFNLG